MRIFIVGPGGVGKTNSGPLLADELKCDFVDLDAEFMKRIGNISRYMDQYGYEGYARANAALAKALLLEVPASAVIALSSGLLVHDGLERLASENRKLLQENGITVCLLPSKDYETAEEIVVQRQLRRNPHSTQQGERDKFQRRYYLYQGLGDICIYSSASSQEIARLMSRELRVYVSQDG